jgi:hypothetical protein
MGYPVPSGKKSRRWAADFEEFCGAITKLGEETGTGAFNFPWIGSKVAEA